MKRCCLSGDQLLVHETQVGQLRRLMGRVAKVWDQRDQGLEKYGKSLKIYTEVALDTALSQNSGRLHLTQPKLQQWQMRPC